MSVESVLTPAERQPLKGRAHRLRPVVWVVELRLAETVIAEVGRALAAHELIKVQTVGLDREAREQVYAELCARCGAQPVQHIGKVLVLFRKKPEPDRTTTKRPERNPATRPGKPGRARRPGRRDASQRETKITRTARRGFRSA